MNRRNFVANLGTQGLVFSGLGSFLSYDAKAENLHSSDNSRPEQITKIGEWSLTEIREIFRNEFFSNNLPIWRNKVVDWEYGGYIPYIKPYYNNTGECILTDKRIYHQSRCFWMYSYLYNHVEKDDFYLKAAKHGYDFLLKNAYDPETSLWKQLVNRKGEELLPYGNIFACIYMFLALGEYYNATGDEEVAKLAEKSAHAIIKELTSNNFQAYGMGPDAIIENSYREPGTRRLGMWMHFLSALTPYLKYKKDPSIETITRFVVRNLLERHYQKDLRFAYEFLQFDYSPYTKSYHTHETMRVADGFHSVETSWMSMNEALRTGNRDMYLDALGFGKDVMEMLWLEREGEQGLVRFYWPDDSNPMERAEILGPYVMNEVWIMLLLAMENSTESWPVEWFEKSFSYAYKTAKLKFPYGETLHHPRGLLFSIEILDRMIARNGRRSDFLESSIKPKSKLNYKK